MEILAVLERRGEEKRGKGSRMKGKFRVTESLARPNQLKSVSLAPNPADASGGTPVETKRFVLAVTFRTFRPLSKSSSKIGNLPIFGRGAQTTPAFALLLPRLREKPPPYLPRAASPEFFCRGPQNNDITLPYDSNGSLQQRLR